jgi:hypothetical protein
LIAAYVALPSVVGGLATIVHAAVADPRQPLVIRIAAALVLAVALIHAHSALRAKLGTTSASKFERALEPATSIVKLDPHFLRIRDELQISMTSRDYFERAFWPLLLGLAARLGVDPPVMPPTDRFGRRGPSAAAIAALVAALERRR